MKHLLWLVLLLPSSFAFTQADTSAMTVSVSGYAELYYTFGFNQPDDHNRPGFIYSHNRHNEFNLNLGFVKTALTSDRVRANLALAAGTYMNANYAAEAGVLKNIYEANAGYKISRNKNLWIDAGVFASHIGFESAISKDCWTLTRSLLADNSPYYESGAKLSYGTDNGKWFLSALIMNGWQHIQRPDANNTPAFGTQISFTPSDKVLLNYSTFIGNERPDDIKQMRYFHNLYGILKFSDQFQVIAGFDYGMEQESEGASDFNTWYSPVFIAKVKLDDQWSVAFRGELYKDENGVIIATGTPNGFQTTGFSVNFDCRLRENAVWRLEGRVLSSKDEIFQDADGELSKTDAAVTTSLAVSF
jgi:hypothetical protein